MTKDEVLKINPMDYKDLPENQCPDFSNGCYMCLDRCSFQFYCKDNLCYSVNRPDFFVNATVEIPNNEGIMTKYLADVCKDKTGKNCYSDDPKCDSNEDCLSNKCVNNYCVANDDFPYELCQDTYHFNAFTAKSKLKLDCGKPDRYPCKKDKDCASRICENSICQFQGRDHGMELVGTAFVYLLIFIIIVIICIISLCIYQIIKHKTSKAV